MVESVSGSHMVMRQYILSTLVDMFQSIQVDMFQFTQNSQVAMFPSIPNIQVVTCQCIPNTQVVTCQCILNTQVVTCQSILNSLVAMSQSTQNNQVAMFPYILSIHQKLAQKVLKLELCPSTLKELYYQSFLMQRPCLTIQRVKLCQRILKLDNIQKVQKQEFLIDEGRERPDVQLKRDQARPQKLFTGTRSNAFVHEALLAQDVKSVSVLAGCGPAPSPSVLAFDP